MVVAIQTTVRYAIADLAKIEVSEDAIVANHVSYNHCEEVLDKIRAVPKDGGNLPRRLMYDCHAREILGRPSLVK